MSACACSTIMSFCIQIFVTTTHNIFNLEIYKTTAQAVITCWPVLLCGDRQAVRVTIKFCLQELYKASVCALIELN